MLNGKVALVTGSTSGIGLGIAEALAAAGAGVMLNGSRPAAEAESMRASLAERCRVKVAYSSANMAKPEEVAEMVAAANAELGSVDILVNNAGIQFVSPVDQFPDDKWRSSKDKFKSRRRPMDCHGSE
jgi:3-hydroxybutyrate dehydrogenase